MDGSVAQVPERTEQTSAVFVHPNQRAPDSRRRSGEDIWHFCAFNLLVLIIFY